MSSSPIASGGRTRSAAALLSRTCAAESARARDHAVRAYCPGQRQMRRRGSEALHHASQASFATSRPCAQDLVGHAASTAASTNVLAVAVAHAPMANPAPAPSKSHANTAPAAHLARRKPTQRAVRVHRVNALPSCSDAPEERRKPLWAQRCVAWRPATAATLMKWSSSALNHILTRYLYQK